MVLTHHCCCCTSLCKSLNSHVFFYRVVLFHLLDKELVGSNSSLGQVHIELKHVDLDEPIRHCYPLADLVSSKPYVLGKQITVLSGNNLS